MSRPQTIGAGSCLILLAILPALFQGKAVLTIVCQIEIAALFALSYNMLLGETGLFSFGHAAFMGLGGFVAIHALRLIASHHLKIPIIILPLIGAMGGLFFGAIFGWLATRRVGTAFIMITLGFSELIGASAFILTDFFGGEEGINGDRTNGAPFVGWDFGPQIQVYYLTALWTVLGIAAIYALTRTPLGSIANATRDSPERASFIGYDPKFVCFLMFCLSATFAGLAGGLYAINYEIITSASLGYRATSMVIVMVYVGGVRQFAGPLIGAVLITLAQVNLAAYTGAWLLYLGLLFVLIIVFAPDGLAGFLMRHAPVARAGLLHKLLPSYSVITASALLLAAGTIAIVEMTWRLSIDSDKGPFVKLAGVTLNIVDPISWLIAIGMGSVGVLGVRMTRPFVDQQWQSIAGMVGRRGG